MTGGWIGVDLDGTLAHSAPKNRSFGPSFIGEPIPLMVDRVKEWLAEGIDVRIFTARVAFDPGDESRAAIEAWCQEHLGQVIPITCQKDYAMVELYDDRARQVEENTGRLYVMEGTGRG